MRSTLLVRCLMTAHGKHSIWTNKYEKCRTVKCYAGNNDNSLICGLVSALNAAGIDFTLKITEPVAHKYSIRPSIIVRLPLEA